MADPLTPDPDEWRVPQASSDEPITRGGDDRLERAAFAKTVAKGIAAGPAGGLVTAIMGPWGSGKTSIINLVADELESGTSNTTILRFNPWYFSATTELVDAFLGELISQLSSDRDELIQKVAKALNDYGQSLDFLKKVPGVGGLAEAAGAALSGASAAARSVDRFGQPTLQQRRAAVIRALADTGRRFLVIIDDIDRLEANEVRDLVRLVRLVGDFPGVDYLLAFDRYQVERALSAGQDARVGRDYLEKIVQVAHEVPPPRRALLQGMLFDRLNDIFRRLGSNYELNEWAPVFRGIVDPILRTPRDGARLVNGAMPVIQQLDDEVNVVDVVGLTALRLYLPTFHRDLEQHAEALTYQPNLGWSGRDYRQEEVKAELEQWLVQVDENPAVAKAALETLFPATRSVLSNYHVDLRAMRARRRVAHPEVLEVYLRWGRTPDDVSSRTVANVFGAFGSATTLGSLVAGLDQAQHEAMLARLEDYEGQFPRDPEEAIVGVLSDLERLRRGRSGRFGDWGADMTLERVVLRLLRRAEPESERTRIMNAVLPRLATLSQRFLLLKTSGYMENAGLELVERPAWEDAMADLGKQVLASTPADLARERDVFRLLHIAKSDRGDPERVAQLLADDGLFLALIRDLLTPVTTESADRLPEVRDEFQWGALESVYGSDPSDRVRGIAGSFMAGEDKDLVTARALAVALKYADGYRPKPFGMGDDEEAEGATEAADQDDDRALTEGTGPA